MKFYKFLLLVCVSLSFYTLGAQVRLSDSHFSGEDVYVYKISLEDLRAIYRKGKKLDETFLHTQVARYHRTEEVPLLPRGNYLLVQAVNNELVYDSYTVDDLQYYFLQGKDFSLYLTDASGEPVREARVRLDNKTLKYNTRTGVYTGKDFKKKRLLELEHLGVYHFISITPQNAYVRQASIFRRGWWGIRSWFTRPNERRAYERAFMVFSKPKYKPGETVKFKAFAASGKGDPVSEPLQVYLGSYGMKDTLLTTLAPYRPGFYKYEFKLSDSLKLKLDYSYYIRLQQVKSKNRVVEESFKLEEYELKGLHLDVRTKTVRHQKQEPPVIFVKVTDENDMAVMEGRCDITVTPRRNYTFLKSEGFVPDVLWKTSVSIDGTREKEVVLPDSIFPPDVSFNYTVNCVYLSPDNERYEKNLSLFYDAGKSLIRFSETGCGLLIEQITEGHREQVDARIVGYSLSGDVISTESVRLPFELRIAENVSFYTIHSGEASATYKASDFGRQLLDGDLYRERDSLRVVVNNPCEYPFWYRLREGDQVIEQGYTTKLDLARTARWKNYYLQVEYLFGGQVRRFDKELVIQEKKIDIRLNTPLVVYPGQKTKVELELSDYRGNPVADADVTAYAMTSKFGSYSPYIPYWGTERADHYRYFYASPDHRQVKGVKSGMNWVRWRKEMGLERMTSYRFLYPEPIYRNEELCPGNITQVAPYAFIDGKLQAVYIVEVDDQPYYYQGAGHRKVYSFPVTPGKHTIALHLYDRVVRVQDLEVIGGRKNIISLDVRESSPDFGIWVEKKPKQWIGKLTPAERNVLGKYMLSVTKNFGYKRLTGIGVDLLNSAYLVSGDFLYDLNSMEFDGSRPYRSYVDVERGSVLTGPFPDLKPITLYVDGEKINRFDAEAGYDYTIGKGYLKLKSYPAGRIGEQLPSFIPALDLKAHVLRAEDIRERRDRLVRQYIKDRRISYVDLGAPLTSTNLFKNHSLELDLKNVRDSSSLFLTLFFDEDHVIRQIYPGKVRLFTDLSRPNWKMVLVFDDYSYYEHSLALKEGGVNYLALDSVRTVRDSGFTHWLNYYVRDKILKMEGVAAKSLVESKPVQSYGNRDMKIWGRIRDAYDGIPLPGCTVYVKGTSVGCCTDVNGDFSLLVQAGDSISCNFIGYKEQCFAIVPGGNYHIFLEEDHVALEEVMVTGYHSVMKRSFVGSVTTVSKGRGRGGREGTAQQNLGKEDIFPLIILNGNPYAGRLEDIDEGTITSMKNIPVEKAVELFGKQGSNGVLVITTSVSGQEDRSGNALRRNFRDEAFWEPALRTGSDGKISFEVTYPDDITNWQARFIAVGNGQMTGFAETSVKSFKAVSARLALPRFVVEGDSVNTIGKMNNYLDDTIAVKQVVSVNGSSREKQLVFSTSHVDTIPVKVSVADSLHVQYSMRKADGFFDGEEHFVPVFKQGCIENLGVFQVLEPDTLYHFRMNPLLGKITVHAETTPADLILREIDKIDIYPYLCNEQMASKLKALLVKKKVCKLLDMRFKEEGKIEKLIIRLTRNQNDSGLWGWWGKGSSIDWISAQVTEALLAAERDGYAVKFNRQQAIECMVSDVVSACVKAKNRRFDKVGCLNRLVMLKALDAPFDYAGYFVRIDTGFYRHTLHEKLLSLQVKQILGLPVNRDSVMQYAQKTMLESLYWKSLPSEKYYYAPDRNTVQNTLLAYRILRDIGGCEQDLRKIRNYFFEVRRSGYWRNIYDASRIIETIFPDMLSGKEAFDADTRLTINGEQILKLPLNREYDPGEELQVRKSGTSPVFFTAYQTAWNPAPGQESKGFSVQTYFRGNKDIVEQLKAGELVELVVEVNASSDAEYVMLEIPIPAGCSFESKEQTWWGNFHREYGKEKVSIFCESLKEGDHVFTVKLIPRFTGEYHVNPARVELMYFPTFYGREGMKEVQIW